MTLMTRRHFSLHGSLTFTAPDFDRLKRIIESPQYRISHAPLLTTLKQELESADVLPPASVPRGIVTMHSQVRVRDVKTRASEAYTLVYPEEADIEQGKLSVLAPLGAALIGRRAGQVVEVAAPGGLRRIKVERILYQPEAAGDFHL
jgi:regulator of nucleoside diphosphate kinase